MRAVFTGEAMLELSKEGEAWRLGYGGDTLNTAIHMARAGITTGYLTALGNDPFSQKLGDDWAKEGLDISLILTDPTHGPGLYAITNDMKGERSFTYWRNDSAARRMFDLPAVDDAIAAIESADLLGFSLISLAILPATGRGRLLDLASRVRAKGGAVAFDGNYRPRLWASVSEAREARDAAIAVADIGLPTLDDEMALEGDLDEGAVAAHWAQLGCTETIVKMGSRGCRLPDGTILSPTKILQPVDTSGAGDAFNGGYLSARLHGKSINEAAVDGNERAAWCVMRRGAIPPID